MPEIVIKLIRPEEGAQIDAAFAIYRDAIEQTEQRPEADFRALVARQDYALLGALLDGEVAGMSLAWIPPNANVWLFEYAAVAPQLRSHGLGANLFLASRHLAGAERTALVEVDAPEGDETKLRRLAFYRSFGCRRLAGLDYLLPLDAFGAPPPMWLLALTSPEDQPTVSVHLVESWLRAIYTRVYDKQLDDPRLARMIDPLPDDVALAAI